MMGGRSAVAPVPATGFATTTGSAAGGAGGAAGMRLREWRRPNSRARRGSRGGLCPTVQWHQCARPAGNACGRAWPWDRAASSAIALENEMTGNYSCRLRAKFVNLRA